jgi:hypothetical protein
MTSQNVIMWGTLIIYNVAIILLLMKVIRSAQLGQALSEKAEDTFGTKETTKVTSKAEGTETVTTTETAMQTSSSRVASFIGAVVMAVFLWGLGNIILYKGSLGDYDEIEKLMASIGSFFLAGSALFAPYAFNQLGTVFKSAARPS